MSDGKVPNATRNDPAMTGELGSPFVAGASDVGMNKGSRTAYRRMSIPASIGSTGAQPALKGQFAHPIPAPKGDRW
jgi:hypothetical protein